MNAIPVSFIVFYGFSMMLAVILSSFYFINVKNASHEEQKTCEFCSTQTPVKYKNSDDITFITVPKPNIDANCRIKYKLAISSWLSCSKSSKVILYVPENDLDRTGTLQRELLELFGEGRVFYKGYLKSDVTNIPYVDDWFRRGVDDAETKYVCFINSDIILSSTWLKRMKQVYSTFDEKKKLVLINQRIDFDLNIHSLQLTYNSSDLLNDIEKLVKDSHHETHPATGIDTFTFRKDYLPFNPDIIPPYVIGRYNWDNWLVGYLTQYATTVSFGIDPPVYHINHVRHSFDIDDPKVAINHNLREINFNFFSTNSDANYYILDGSFLVSRTGSRIKLPRDIE